MDPLNQDWMAYVDGEVRAACTRRRLGCQVRRKWSVRDKPVSESPVDDYEWKLIPNRPDAPTDQRPRQFDEGTYYVLGIDRRGARFLLQHDTMHAGMQPEWHLRTYTEMSFGHHLPESALQATGSEVPLPAPPPTGWLCGCLMKLTLRWAPNQFSIT